MPLIFPDTLTTEASIEWPELALPCDSAGMAQIRMLVHPDLQAVIGEWNEVVWAPNGVAGDPLPYAFANDDTMLILLIASFVIMAWAIAASWKFLGGFFRDFFYTRIRPSLFAEREDTVLHGSWLIIAETSFLTALIAFTLMRAVSPEGFAQTSPYTLLGTATTVAAGYYMAKLGLYALVNRTFFPADKCAVWADTYLVSVLATSCCLLPLVVAVVFFDLSAGHSAMVCILLEGVIKTLLLYKCHTIFFKTRLGGVHIILYLCALEIIPLLLLVAIMAFAMASVAAI